MSGKNTKEEIRLRIAPSPTGYPHIGTIYQALFNYAFAKKNNGKFIVRIEDTDRERFVEDAEEKIFQTFDWFGLEEDESVRKDGHHGPYRQSERIEIYHKYAQELIDKGGAYFSYFPKEERDAEEEKDPPTTIEQMLNKKDWVVRLKIPREGKITVRDEIRGDIAFNASEVTNQVLIKSDGFPTYHLAVVVDDHLMKISDAVRGEEWITSFPKHKLIYDYLGWKMPRFYHTPVLRNPDKSKLSKRQGHTNAQWYQEQGFVREAILNFLALMGWTHSEEKEIFSLNEFIEKVELKKIRPVAPIFDVTKLEWMNGEYIRAMEDEELGSRIVERDEQLKKIDTETFLKFISLAKTRMKKLSEFDEMVKPFLSIEEKNEVDNTGLKSELRNNLASIEDWSTQKLYEEIKKTLDEKNMRFPQLYQVLTGKKFGLPLADVFEILGKEKTLNLLSD